MITQIKKLAEDFHPQVVAFRRHLHQFPELSFQEFRTTEFIHSKLNDIGIEVSREFSETGMIAYIKGKNPEKKCIAVRADIDALPIEEENEIAYRSKNPGIMHACGHDVHSANLYGTALILNELTDQFEGTVKLIFQPGEELLPGGAALLIEQGVLDSPKVDSIYALHVYPELEAGMVGFRPGLYMASADELHITISGKGGHAALVEQLVDPVEATNHLLIEVRKAIQEHQLENVPYVIGFGDIKAKGATNVIPNKVHILGTFRTMDEDWRSQMHELMQSTAREIEEKFRVHIDFNIIIGYPFLHNDERLTQDSKKWAIQYLGEENVTDLPLRMTSEDFASYTHHTPGCFYRLGTSNNNEHSSSVHTPTFNVNENALKVGMGLMSWLTINELKLD